MGQVAVRINGRSYQIACDDGQEANLVRLSEYVDKRVGQLVAAVGQVGEDRLLVMASLLVADELSDAYGELKTLRATADAAARNAGRQAAGPDAAARDSAYAKGLDALAVRVERLAELLERP